MDLYIIVSIKTFNSIKNREETTIYKPVSNYWTERLVKREYRKIIVKKGGSMSSEPNSSLEFYWKECSIENVIHEDFGGKQTCVFSIDVSEIFSL